MILVGNQRGGAKDLAQHLLKEENDHVHVHEVRGFASADLGEALHEAYAVSRGTRCKQFLFSLSVNPPPDKTLSTADFEDAIGQVETKLCLTGQPRAIVFHEKEGRRHAHAVWSRIDADAMKAVQLSHSKRKLMDVSRDLHRQYGLTPPRGLLERSQRDPRNFSLDDWQQAKRQGTDPRDIKTHLQDAWALSDSPSGLKHALEERGYRLARGDRRGHVAVDYRGEVYALARWAGVKTKDVRARLGEPDSLPSVDAATAGWGSDMLRKAQMLQKRADQKAQHDKAEHAANRLALFTTQRAERSAQAQALALRQRSEARDRQARFRTGLKGLWDRLRGEHRRISEQNLQDAAAAEKRDQAERDRLINNHLTARRALVQDRAQQKEKARSIAQDLKEDQGHYAALRDGIAPKIEPPARSKNFTRAPPRVKEAKATEGKTQEAKTSVPDPQSRPAQPSDRDTRRAAFHEKRKTAPQHSPERGPSLER